MNKLLTHEGVVAPLMRNNVDTDAIIPSVEIKRVSKKGLSGGLFAAWRYQDRSTGELNPDFVLNQRAYQGASILLGGRNFGCGSSREHAVWALDEFGIRVLIAPSFGSIFSANCVANGLLPVCLPESRVQELADWVAADPQKHRLEIDLPARVVRRPDGKTYEFDILETDAEMLMRGLDPIDMTLQLENRITAFEQSSREERPWIQITNIQ